jgi:enamine deaminase RidA (YjgF/YER057c/UK114 family)
VASKQAPKRFPGSRALVSHPALSLPATRDTVGFPIGYRFKEEARQTMENIRTCLEAHGCSMASLVKCTVMLADMSEWPAFNEVYASFFSGNYPARSALGANGLALGARVEVECIAAIDS